MVPVWVHHRNDLQKKIFTYALLDDQSDACFIKDSALKMLEINGPEIELELSTVLAQKKIKSQKITGVVVREPVSRYNLTKNILPIHYTCPTRSNKLSHKIVSNSKDVLQSFPPEESSSGIKDLNLVLEKLPVSLGCPMVHRVCHITLHE